MSYKDCKKIKDESQIPAETFYDGLVYALPEINQQEFCLFWLEDGKDEPTCEFIDSKYENTIPQDGLFLVNVTNYLKAHPKHILFFTKNSKDGYLYATDVFRREYNWAKGEYIECVHYERYIKYLSEFDIPFVEVGYILENNVKTPVKYEELMKYDTHLLKRYNYRDENGAIIWYRGKNNKESE